MFDLTHYHSCRFCQKFVIDFNKKPPLDDVSNNQEDTIKTIFLFDATLKDVLEGVSHHCQLCVWLDHGWDQRCGDRYRLLAKASADRVTVCAESYSFSLIDRYPFDELLYIGFWEYHAPADPKLGKCRIRCGGVSDIFTTKGL
ncbi:hypothetical protein M434DRAFT_292355 [Hypoxylon sp. CO27-5]|nr:hypothetical protein M434DRAFT_292355 [Hypoxylon sp. CO27-5]